MRGVNRRGVRFAVKGLLYLGVAIASLSATVDSWKRRRKAVTEPSWLEEL